MAQIKTNLQYGVTGSLQTGSIAGDAIDGTKIADDAINSEHLAAGGIDTAHIANSQITNALMADNAIGLAEMAGGTDGNIITYDASGNPAVVASGTSGHFLKSQGADTVPVFAAAGGGKVVQMVTAKHRGEISSTSIDSSWYTLANPALAITPTATDNTILIQWFMSNHMSGGDQDRSVKFDLERVITGGATTSRLAYTADGSATTGLGYRASNITAATVGSGVPTEFHYATYGGYGQRPYVWADTTYNTTSVCTYKMLAASYSANSGTYWYGGGAIFVVAVAWEIEG